MANHFIPLYYQRFLASVQGWDDDAVGAYLRLLMYQFQNGRLPADLKSLQKIAPSSRKNWRILSSKFRTDSEGFLYNEVMDEIRQELERKSLINTENGRRGGRPKKNRSDIDSETDRISESKPKQEANQNHTNGSGYRDISEYNHSGGLKGGEQEQPILRRMLAEWKQIVPSYPLHVETDLPALYKIGEFIAGQEKLRWLPETPVEYQHAVDAWLRLAKWIGGDAFYAGWSLAQVSTPKNLQTIFAKSKQQKQDVKPTKRDARQVGTLRKLDELERRFTDSQPDGARAAGI
jgi:uncharacterized protein YdaU (DUF1376 family)